MKINITIPCYNEEIILKKNITSLFNFLRNNIGNDEWFIVIADNNSTDNTGRIGRELANSLQNVKYIFTEKKGKGIAIKTGWQKYEADIYAFMDADLSTGLESFPELIHFIKEKKYSIASGSRFHKKSTVDRTILRKFISRAYRLVKGLMVKSKISDLPCGFKAVDKKIVDKILPQVKNNSWFFDSELLILAEHQGYPIKEIPVSWKDLREGEDKSKVKVLSLSIEYFINIIELKKRLKN